MEAPLATVKAPVLRDVSIRGVRVRFLEVGVGPPVILVHGYLASHTAWHAVVGSLAARFRVIAPDLPGFGESEKPPPSRYAYTASAFAESLVDLIAALDVNRVVRHRAPDGERRRADDVRQLPGSGRAPRARHAGAVPHGVASSWERAALAPRRWAAHLQAGRRQAAVPSVLRPRLEPASQPGERPRPRLVRRLQRSRRARGRARDDALDPGHEAAPGARSLSRATASRRSSAAAGATTTRSALTQARRSWRVSSRRLAWSLRRGGARPRKIDPRSSRARSPRSSPSLRGGEPDVRALAAPSLRAKPLRDDRGRGRRLAGRLRHRLPMGFVARPVDQRLRARHLAERHARRPRVAHSCSGPTGSSAMSSFASRTARASRSSSRWPRR